MDSLWRCYRVWYTLYGSSIWNYKHTFVIRSIFVYIQSLSILILQMLYTCVVVMQLNHSSLLSPFVLSLTLLLLHPDFFLQNKLHSAPQSFKLLRTLAVEFIYHSIEFAFSAKVFASQTGRQHTRKKNSVAPLKCSWNIWFVPVFILIFCRFMFSIMMVHHLCDGWGYTSNEMNF